MKKKKNNIMMFEQWLKEIYLKSNGQPLSDASVERYKQGLLTTSIDMQKEQVIGKPLEEMELVELDLAISIVMNNKIFIEKDTRGDRMYSTALKRYRCYVYHNTNLGKKELEEVNKIRHDKSLRETEKKTLIKARKGQGLFRDKLRKKYNNKCVVTNINITQVLVASHIKPWSVSNNEERLSVDNGLLLSATFDRLFDSGLISFKKDGTILISSLISRENKEKLNLVDGQIYDIKYNDNMGKFLNYHNEVIYIGNVK